MNNPTPGAVKSGVITDVTSPPVAETRETTRRRPETKRGSRHRGSTCRQSPTPASHSVAASPPETSIFLSLPSAKKPMKRLSGDQKG